MAGTRRRSLTSADRDVLYAGRCLEFHPIAVPTEDWGRTLSTFEIDLKRDGTVVDHSCATDVLGGPVSALRYLSRYARARSGQSATRSRRYRHDRYADACTSGRTRRNMDGRTHACRA